MFLTYLYTETKTLFPLVNIWWYFLKNQEVARKTMADNDNAYSQWFLDEFEKLNEELEAAERNPNFISDDIRHSNQETGDHDVQLNCSFENDRNVSESSFSPETRFVSSPATSLIFHCHRNSNKVSISDSIVGAQPSNYEATEKSNMSSFLVPVETSQSDVFRIDNTQSNISKNISSQNNIWWSNWRTVPQDILKKTSFGADISEVPEKSHMRYSLGTVETPQGFFGWTDNNQYNPSEHFLSQNNIGWSNWSAVPQDMLKNTNFGADTFVVSEKSHISSSLGTVETPQGDFFWRDNNQSNTSEEFSSQNNFGWSNWRPVPQNILKNTSFGADTSEVSGKRQINSSLVPVETPQHDFCWRDDYQSNDFKPLSSQNTVGWSNWRPVLQNALKNRSLGANISVASGKSHISSSFEPVAKPQSDFCWRDYNQQNHFKHVPSQNNFGWSNWMPLPQNELKNVSFGAIRSSFQEKENESWRILPESKFSHLDSISPSQMSIEKDENEATELKGEEYRKISATSTIFSPVADIPNIEMATNKLSLGSVADSALGPSGIQKQSRKTGNKKPFVCEFCGKIFNQACSLQIHRRIHTREKPFVCKTCSKRFTYNRSLKSHLMEHSGEWPYPCSQCDKKFAQKFEFDRHLRTHTKEKPFICDVCNKGFSRKCNLKLHHNTHTKEKPFICDVCNKGFSQKCNLKVHYNTHTIGKPYMCGLCGKGMSRKRNLIEHQKKINNRK